MKLVKIFKNGLCTLTEITVSYPTGDKTATPFPQIFEKSTKEVWNVLTRAEKTCFPDDKIESDNNKVDGLYLFVNNAVEKTEENVCRLQFPFPLNMRIIYGDIILAYSSALNKLEPINISQWQHTIEVWVGTTSDLSIMQRQMHNNHCKYYSEEEKMCSTSDTIITEDNTLMSEDEELFSDEEYCYNIHCKDDYNENLQDEIQDEILETMEPYEEDLCKDEEVIIDDDDEEPIVSSDEET